MTFRFVLVPHNVSFVLFLILRCFLLSTRVVLGRIVAVDNAEPRHDAQGHILNSHDGSIVEHEGMFYKYGTVQPDCIGEATCKKGSRCGWGDNDFAVYKSQDLSNWTMESANLLPDRPTGSGGFLPKVIFNRRTQLFVMWWTARWYGVATSPSPVGPFQIVSLNVTTRFCCGGSSINFFLDETTDDVYLVSNWEPLVNGSGKEQSSVELLTHDYTGSTMNSSGLLGPVGSEGAVMLQEHPGADYRLILPSLCCFCPWGAGSSVLRASHPLGPWEQDGTWNGPWESCVAGDGNVSQICRTSAIVPQQPSSLVKLNATLLSHGNVERDTSRDAVASSLWMLIGDRWLSAPDKKKSHDFQAWVPIQFDTKGQLLQPEWHGGTPADNWIMDVGQSETEAFV